MPGVMRAPRSPLVREGESSPNARVKRPPAEWQAIPEPGQDASEPSRLGQDRSRVQREPRDLQKGVNMLLGDVVEGKLPMGQLGRLRREAEQPRVIRGR